MTIEEGLDFIEGHLQVPTYPRRIATYTTGGNQIQVNNRYEALARFNQSNLLDCRISAYPYPVPECKGVNRQSPDFFLSDLDRKNFKTNKLFEKSMHNILQNFKDRLHGAKPTVLWSGGGYHFLQPLYADMVLEEESVFAEFVEPSIKLSSIKLSLTADVLQQIICTIKIRRAPTRHDNIDFRPIITKTSEILPLSVVTADKAYDSEENHVLVRELLHGFSIIPTRYENVPIWKTHGRYRKQMKRGYSKLLYGQRNKNETIVSVIKRLFGEHITSRLVRTQNREVGYSSTHANGKRLTKEKSRRSSDSDS